MTHALNRATTANYHHLDQDDQAEFDRYMERADNAATNGEYLAHMVIAARIAGINLPYGGHIRLCACSCSCPTIFNPDHPDAHCIEQTPDYNLDRHQCPTCADWHRETA
ncbi:hypothetical protein ACWGOK_36230 [Streptomyces eurythermus]